MKTQNVNNRLAFNKTAVAELEENSLQQVNGGSSTTGCFCDIVQETLLS